MTTDAILQAIHFRIETCTMLLQEFRRQYTPGVCPAKPLSINDPFLLGFTRIETILGAQYNLIRVWDEANDIAEARGE